MLSIDLYITFYNFIIISIANNYYYWDWGYEFIDWIDWLDWFIELGLSLSLPSLSFINFIIISNFIDPINRKKQAKFLDPFWFFDINRSDPFYHPINMKA